MSPEERADFAFLLERVPLTGGFRGSDEHRWWGISSNAMVEYAYGGPFPGDRIYPRDRSDLAACVRAMRRAPRHRRSSMKKVLAVYKVRLAALQQAEG